MKSTIQLHYLDLKQKTTEHIVFAPVVWSLCALAGFLLAPVATTVIVCYDSVSYFVVHFIFPLSFVIDYHTRLSDDDRVPGLDW